MPEELIGAHELKELRVQIDACIKYAGREVALARTKLQEAKMWVGKALGALGSELPEEFRDEAPPKE